MNSTSAISRSGQQLGDWELGFDGVHFRVRRQLGLALDEVSLNVFGFGAFSITSNQASTTYFRDGSSQKVPFEPGQPKWQSFEDLTGTVSVLGFLELVLKKSREIWVKHRLDQRQWILDTQTSQLRMTLPGETEPTIEFQFEQRLAPPRALEDEDGPYVEELQVLEGPVKPDADPTTQALEQDDGEAISLIGAGGKEIRFTLPFELDNKELKILELLAKYSTMTEKSLGKALDSRRPVRMAVSRLAAKFQALNVSLLKEEGDTHDEGRIYAFNYEAAERLGVAGES